MLHSYHYYACYYYALLCLLQQHQQQALAITIIIEGAQTNEWATRDEYQQVVDPAIVNTFGMASQQQQQFDDGSPPLPPSGVGGAGSGSGSPSDGGDGGPSSSVDREEQAIPTVELIQARLNQKQPAATVKHHQLQQQQANQPRRRKERELAAKKYCGRQLIELLENICNSRYYSGESEPQTLEPTVKTRRSLRTSKLYDTLLGKQASSGLEAAGEQDNSNIIINTNNDPFINGNLYHGRPLLRRIRGASQDCCLRSCHADELKLYCQA